MTELTPELEATGRELHAALGRRIAKMQRRVRRARQAAVVVIRRLRRHRGRERDR